MTVYVVSTGLSAPTKQRCLDSVAEQLVVDARHYYVEAGAQVPPRDVVTNWMSVVDGLPPEAIVVLLDGDDWLAHPKALETVEGLHRAGAWVTYGSFRCADGTAGFASAYGPDEDVRKSDWRATHLKTVRAGLMQRLRPEDLAWPAGAPVPWDQLVMFAAIEMSGWGRSVFCPEILAIYNVASSYEATHGPDGLAEERKWEAVLRERAPYARIEAL
jgi:hypothetical protein